MDDSIARSPDSPAVDDEDDPDADDANAAADRSDRKFADATIAEWRDARDGWC